MGRFSLQLSKCKTVFFDLEFYVPESNRKKTGLNYNPWDKKNRLLGGSFYTMTPNSNVDLSREQISKKIKSFWIWDFNNERCLLEAIYQFILEHSKSVRKAHQNKHGLVLCGIGITTSDTPVLFELFKRFKILSNSDAFIFQSELRYLDLSQLALMTFNCKHDYLYPKTKNDILNKFMNGERFACGSDVWALYEKKAFSDIETRTETEVICTFEVYKLLIAEIRKLKTLEEQEKKNLRWEMKNK